MPIIVNTLKNASNEINGVRFERHEDGYMHSVDAVEGSMLDLFLSIPGFHLLTRPEPANSPMAETESNADCEYAWHTIPQKITGSVVDSGAMNLNIPQPDGSVIQLQATGPTDTNPVLRGDFGMAAAAAASWAAREPAAAGQAEQPVSDAAVAPPADSSAPGAQPAEGTGQTADSTSTDTSTKIAGARGKAAVKK